MRNCMATVKTRKLSGLVTPRYGHERQGGLEREIQRRTRERHAGVWRCPTGPAGKGPERSAHSP